MNTKQEVKQVRELVEHLLLYDERCRNDDKWLTYRVFQTIAEQHGEKIYMPFNLFSVFPAFETIKRTRANIQNKEGRFLPTDLEVINKRSKRQVEFRNIFGDRK